MKNPTLLPAKFAALAVDARHCKGNILPPIHVFSDSLPPVRNIAIPFNFDSEYVDNLERYGSLSSEKFEGRFGVTVQIRGATEQTGWIFACQDLVNLASETGQEIRHPVVRSPCVVQDWLQAKGIDAEIYRDPEQYAKTRKTCRLMLAAHAAMFDVMFLAGTGEFAELIVDLFKNGKLKQARRLVARASKHQNARTGTANLSPWLFRIGEFHYRLSLEIIDSIGLHGIASYKELASNTGVVLEAKDLISRTGSNADIARMDQIYFERPDDFDDYALGDLFVTDIIYANEKLWGDVWDALGIAHLYSGPKLTIGATVADIVQNKIANAMGANLTTEREELIDATTGRHNAAHLSRLVKDKNPCALLSKVDGGRCRNAKPTTVVMQGALCDIDIAGAYASAMTATPLIFGCPRQCGYGNARDRLANLEPCPSLAEWLRRFEHRLVDRAWFARVSTREPFSFETDLIPSWVNFRTTLAKSDSELAGFDNMTDPASGEMRYFSREIWSGTLTSDLLDVARNTMSPAQFAEWTDKIVVRSALYVDQKDRLDLETFGRHFRAGTLPEHAWTSLTLGELVSDVARANRMRYAKNSPLNILFKLVSNTTYGDAVSRHFQSSSAIAGSNVTGTVRGFMYLAEKGLALIGSITDGQLFDLNAVLYPRHKPDKRFPHLSGHRRPSDAIVGTRAYRLNFRQTWDVGMAKLAPLIGRKIETRWNGEAVELTVEHPDGTTETLVGKTALDRIDQAAFDHLARLWPKCKLLSDTFRAVAGLNPDGGVKYADQTGIFRFETKSLVSRAALHGSANYLHVPTDATKTPAPKMRSFEGRRAHSAFSVDADGSLIELDAYQGRSPADVFLNAILNDPHAVPVLPPFTKTRALKPSLYQANAKYQAPDVNIVPGDSIFVMGRPRLFSLAQFTYQTRAQYDAWRKVASRFVNKYGWSFERWFVNPDGTTVDFVAMVHAVDDAICAGVQNPVAHFDKLFVRRDCPAAKAFHLASTKMRDHLDGRLSTEESDLYETLEEIDETEGFAGENW